MRLIVVVNPDPYVRRRPMKKRMRHRAGDSYGRSGSRRGDDSDGPEEEENDQVWYNSESDSPDYTGNEQLRMHPFRWTQSMVVRAGPSLAVNRGDFRPMIESAEYARFGTPRRSTYCFLFFEVRVVISLEHQTFAGEGCDTGDGFSRSQILR